MSVNVGTLRSSFPCGVVNRTVVLSLSGTSNFGSISGRARAVHKSIKSMSFHNGALLTESHQGYDSSFDPLYLPKFSLVAREARPNSFLIGCIAWGLTIRGMFVTVFSMTGDPHYIVTAATGTHTSRWANNIVGDVISGNAGHRCSVCKNGSTPHKAT